ncbi:hypothetical protein GQX73_g7403 [Xylaria multiplex]|uniref:Formyl transferase N-terminal domain-containing protein n=1 Tax=Xylaria multiplex TaxID=323545 RepID=A0A7C8ITL3_9PEZI|nr:hypothetical protein GQX73_g7403 [Xylaria multiplex]
MGYAFHRAYQYTTKSLQHKYRVSAGSPYQDRRYSTLPEEKPEEKPEDKPEEKPEKTSDPLHILFCGSDQLSCDVLKALYNEHVDNPDLIQSIDVVVRPAKRTGRGLQKLTEPPVRVVAEERDLKVHTRDTFTGWDMPAETNLIITASFGLFVPPRLLRAAKYGGLNLHLSLIPDLRGPAPLHHALLRNYKITGVSLQTLDHNKFDRGVVLAQTPYHPKSRATIRIPDAYQSPAILRSHLTPAAIRLLISGLRDNLHVPPYEATGWVPTSYRQQKIRRAPKITKRDRQLTYALIRVWDSNAPRFNQIITFNDLGPLMRRQRIIGPLWFLSRDRHGRQKRIIITAIEDITPQQLSSWLSPSNPINDNNDGDGDDSSITIMEMMRRAIPRNNFKLPSMIVTKRAPKPWQFAIPFEEELQETTTTPSSPSSLSPEQNQQTSPQQQDGSNGNLETPIPEPQPEPQKPHTMNLIFWAPEDYSTTRSPSSIKPDKKEAAKVGRDEGESGSEGALYLGPYRVISLKVEGDKEKPARDALQSFVINTEDWRAYHKRVRELAKSRVSVASDDDEEWSGHVRTS